MIEILLAAFVPVVVLLIAARLGDEDFRRASVRFAVLALLWFAPCWLRGRSPAAFDYLAEDVPPWQRAGFRSATLYLPMTERAARIAREPDLVRAPPLTLAYLNAFRRVPPRPLLDFLSVRNVVRLK